MDSPARLDIFLAWFVALLSAMVRGFKYGYRSQVPAAKSRLLDHASRRHEELSSWLMLQEDWAVYLVRLAATRVGLDLGATCILENPAQDPRKLLYNTVIEDLPFLSCAAELAPELLRHVRQREDGSVEVPVAAILLQMVIPLCAERYTGEPKQRSRREILGGRSYFVFQLESRSVLFVGLLPTMLRFGLLRDRNWVSKLCWEEWVVSVCCFMTLSVMGVAFVGMVLHSCTIMFRRRNILLSKLCSLLSGTCPFCCTWRLSLDYSQVALWNKMRRAVLVLGENYERRSVAALGMYFAVVVVVKVYCLFLFLSSTLSGEKISLKDRPVTIGLAGLCPFVFAPGILNALAEGATLNAQAQRSLRLAIIERRAALVDAQAAVNGMANRMFDGDRQRRRSGVLNTDDRALASVRCLEAADFESHIKHLELVELAYDHVLDEVENMKNTVLLGWGGDGLFELNHALVLRYVTESILNLAFLSQALTFD